MKRHAKQTLGAAAALLAIGLAWPAGMPAQAQPARARTQTPAPPTITPEDLSDEASEGIDSVRVENEMKINVPDSLVEKVWAYLNERYLPRPLWLEGGAGYSARASDENFTDVYYDTPDFWFLNNDNGLRHRSRVIPGQPTNRKNGRELMQIKLQRVGPDTTSRSEIKFQIRHYPRNSRRNNDDNLPALGIVKRGDRPAFLARLTSLGVDGRTLHEALTIHQRRRRIYLSDDVRVFHSLTLDQTSAQKWWMKQQFTEIELEINEIAYTGASPARRHFLEQLNEQVRADLVAKFPQLVQDQTPKYSKMIAGFRRDHALFTPLWNLSMNPRAKAAGFVALLVVILGVAGIRAERRRRARAMRPRSAGLDPEMTAAHQRLVARARA